jgi:hypothetical protein
MKPEIYQWRTGRLALAQTQFWGGSDNFFTGTRLGDDLPQHRPAWFRFRLHMARGFHLH